MFEIRTHLHMLYTNAINTTTTSGLDEDNDDLIYQSNDSNTNESGYDSDSSNNNNYFAVLPSHGVDLEETNPHTKCRSTI